RERCRPVIHRRVSHFHSGQLANERLKLEDRLERALRYLRLIRRVRSKKLRSRNDVIYDGGNVMLISPGAEETDAGGSGVASRKFLKTGQQLNLGKRWGGVEIPS